MSEKLLTWFKKTFLGQIILLFIAPFQKGNALLVFVYMVFFVFMSGNIGLAYEAYTFQKAANPTISYLDALQSISAIKALIMFSFPVVGVSVATLILGERPKIIIVSAMISLVLTWAAGLYLLFEDGILAIDRFNYSLYLAIFALFIWWIANGSDDIFDDGSTATGGPTDQKLNGDINDFTR